MRKVKKPGEANQVVDNCCTKENDLNIKENHLNIKKLGGLLDNIESCLKAYNNEFMMESICLSL